MKNWEKYRFQLRGAEGGWGLKGRKKKESLPKMKRSKYKRRALLVYTIRRERNEGH